MTFFEGLLLLLFVAVVLLQVARRLSLPYPALLASAGVLLALIPGTPVIPIDPATYLALFIAPVLVDAAFDFPPGAPRRFLAPLIALAVIGVVLSAAAVASLATALLGLPWAAAFVLGAIVAPPDAAAASAVLRGVSIPSSTSAVLQGESLFNDSTALLIFSAALAILQTHGLHPALAFRLAAAVPGGVLFGVVCGYLAFSVNRFAGGTLGGNLLQFLMAYSVWILATHLQLSAVLATVAFAMTIARRSEVTPFSARMRVQSFAVWSVVVFSLNVFAFMLMGMQARLILARMPHDRLREALGFAALVTVVLIVVRLAATLSFNRLDTLWERAHGRPEPATVRQALFVGWCGMRGFVTMATALSLPPSFPRRDIVVLTAFIVVLATLVLQGASLSAVIRLLGLERREELQGELFAARTAMARASLAHLRAHPSLHASHLSYPLALVEGVCSGVTDPEPLRNLQELGLQAVLAARQELEAIRLRNEVGVESYLQLQEQLDWKELTVASDDDRRIEEI